MDKDDIIINLQHENNKLKYIISMYEENNKSEKIESNKEFAKHIPPSNNMTCSEYIWTSYKFKK